ncbi:hypothetical protein QBC39DRAFT_339185 [Podospora conica]|nr:hypothetical protein QBC39DRAFT_339185 [Schizothecium conicum]
MASPFPWHQPSHGINLPMASPFPWHQPSHGINLPMASPFPYPTSGSPTTQSLSLLFLPHIPPPIAPPHHFPPAPSPVAVDLSLTGNDKNPFVRQTTTPLCCSRCSRCSRFGGGGLTLTGNREETRTVFTSMWMSTICGSVMLLLFLQSSLSHPSLPSQLTSASIFQPPPRSNLSTVANTPGTTGPGLPAECLVERSRYSRACAARLRQSVQGGLISADIQQSGLLVCRKGEGGGG